VSRRAVIWVTYGETLANWRDFWRAAGFENQRESAQIRSNSAELFDFTSDLKEG